MALKEKLTNLSEYRIPSIKNIKKLLGVRNQVLVKTKTKNAERQTKSGIFVVGDTDFNPAEHADRISEIYMVPDYLYFSPIGQMGKTGAPSMEWLTKLDVRPGDIVCHDFMGPFNTIVFLPQDEPDERYMLLNYADLYARKRNGKIKPLNGYIFCEEVKEMVSYSELAIEKEYVNKKYGVVAMIGEKNQAYLSFDGRTKKWRAKDADGDPDIEIGDTIIKRNPNIHIMLESDLHAEFFGGKNYFIIQRKDIYGIIKKNSYSNNS